MDSRSINREESFALLKEYTKSDNLIKHALAVEAAMRAYAHRLESDEEKWGITGLLHDLDYELHPSLEEHPAVGSQILEEAGYPGDVVYAIRAHGEHLGLDRKSPLDKALFAVDELVGFITAVALVRPSKSIMDVEVSSVKKKMKDKAFARAVDREALVKGAEELGISFDEHVAIVIAAMQGIAKELGLQGNA
ncbi:MAG: HDIG domain-containing protein [Chloroflexi bacterium]|nr:HDIG domain-containing protein [Chloroflexota bacterium]MCL5075456.1 HDIG domain-containing protein [Chloroflexota bacterium]